MIKYIGKLAMFSAVMTSGMLTGNQALGYQSALDRHQGYLTQNGNEVTVLLPIESLYQQQTTYMAEGAIEVADILESLIRQSSGRVYLKGLLNEAQPDIVFATSALYAQVSHLSEYLLKSVSGISYSPVTVSEYQKNANYRIWEMFPEAETFVSLSLVID